MRSELATFLDVFPNGAVFANTVDGVGYDAVLVGRKSDEPIDLTRLERRLDRSDYETVAASLRAVGFDSALDLMSTYAADAAVAGTMARRCRAQHGSRSSPAVSRRRRFERARRRRDLRCARRLGTRLARAVVHGHARAARGARAAARGAAGAVLNALSRARRAAELSTSSTLRAIPCRRAGNRRRAARNASLTSFATCQRR